MTSFRITLYLSSQEAKLSQEQLADQVVKTSEEKHNLLKELVTVKKVRGGEGRTEGRGGGEDRGEGGYMCRCGERSNVTLHQSADLVSTLFCLWLFIVKAFPT